MLKSLKRLLTRNVIHQTYYNNISSPEMDQLKMLVAKTIVQNNSTLRSSNIQDYEFKVFSQWGDDGIIQHLVNTIEFPNKTFIEFGVQDYTESNTRFLMMNNNWTGLIMDGSDEFMNKVKSRDYYWQHNLTVLARFVTAENINDLIAEVNLDKEVGIYHIDIDGNDYWVWQATKVINPILVIVEYQSVFGSERAITTPYQPDFVRGNAHYSNLYYGVSIQALCDLAEEKGYYFIGCNSAGNNAYFVRKDKIGGLTPLTASQGYSLSKFREARDESGKLLYLSGEDRGKLIKGMPVFNTRTKKIEEF